jgi:hypothetical protein
MFLRWDGPVCLQRDTASRPSTFKCFRFTRKFHPFVLNVLSSSVLFLLLMLIAQACLLTIWSRVNSLWMGLVTGNGWRSFSSLQGPDRVSAVGTDWTTKGSESRWRQQFSLLHAIQTGSGARPPSYPMGTGSSFPGGKAARA